MCGGDDRIDEHLAPLGESYRQILVTA